MHAVRRRTLVGTVLCAFSLWAPASAPLAQPAQKRFVPRLLKYSHAIYKPRAYCPANHTCFSKAHWLRWTPKHAVARATGQTSYPGGPMITERIAFRFSAPRHVCGGWFFTHAKWRYRGDPRYTEAFMLTPACIWTGA